MIYLRFAIKYASYIYQYIHTEYPQCILGVLLSYFISYNAFVRVALNFRYIFCDGFFLCEIKF